MSQCMRCGAPFACGMVDKYSTDLGPCWCSALPALPADVIGAAQRAGTPASCLCPACLYAAVAAPLLLPTASQ
ncbi:MAG: cysteine-rich CWC family protein [Glaciimonas sp.]|nr:cysteine-rich CWC family protein [Glaciimonas sp.]